MTESNSAPSTIADLFRQTQMNLGMSPVIGPQAEHFWKAQETILSDTEKFAKHWFERRHTATRTALDTVRDLTRNGSSDPAAAAKAIANWQEHSMERISEDFKEWLDLCTRCAGHLSRAEAKAGEEGMKEIAKSARSTKRKKDDIPV